MLTEYFTLTKNKNNLFSSEWPQELYPELTIDTNKSKQIQENWYNTQHLIWAPQSNTGCQQYRSNKLPENGKVTEQKMGQN